MADRSSDRSRRRRSPAVALRTAYAAQPGSGRRFVDVGQRKRAGVPEDQPAGEDAGQHLARGQHGETAVRAPATELIDARLLVADPAADLAQPVDAHLLDAECLQFPDRALDVLPLVDLDDADAQRDAASHRLPDVGQRPVVAPVASDCIVSAAIGRVVRRGPAA
jgi:hypothetical protein